jgi:hypothetical protein
VIGMMNAASATDQSPKSEMAATTVISQDNVGAIRTNRR